MKFVLCVGRCDVRSLLPGAADTSLSDTSAASADRAEKQLGTRGGCRERDRRPERRAAKKLLALLEDPSGVPPTARVHRYGKHAHHGVYGASSLLYCE